jgi:hypothetical protein
MIPKSGQRFPACAKPRQPLGVSFDASAGKARSEKIMRQQMLKRNADSTSIILLQHREKRRQLDWFVGLEIFTPPPAHKTMRARIK